MYGMIAQALTQGRARSKKKSCLGRWVNKTSLIKRRGQWRLVRSTRSR